MEDQELQTINAHEMENDHSPDDQGLPRVDGGLGAWLVLASVFIQGALIWGIVKP